MFAILLIFPQGGGTSGFGQACKWLLMETCVKGCPGTGSFLMVYSPRIGAQVRVGVACLDLDLA